MLSEKYYVGRVVLITASGIVVQHEADRYTCSVRGVLKRFKKKDSDRVVVGDQVFFDIIIPQKEGVILKVGPRASLLFREGPYKKKDLLAANIDRVLITHGWREPGWQPKLADRYIVMAIKADITPILVINKADLMNEDERAEMQRYSQIYESIGVKVIILSLLNGEGMDQLKEVMSTGVSLFSGKSGTGKTSLTNFLTGSAFATTEVNIKTKKGAHTTTETRLLTLICGGFCIDTPGIRSFGLAEVKSEELKDLFIDMVNLSENCRFSGCAHLAEPNCAVKEGLKNGQMSQERWDSYKTLFAELKEKEKEEAERRNRKHCFTR
ncbi:ribosome small subunit-dependent GTPase A [Candidatus Clavichlamydia salmonicola]|uniref:ribosome small subunit-dependent GTPase A n=1 Tax=Candidatus Clavichlamydia salmonicola TaxID=469812 RepID=UPI0018919EF8|nr:ribosome small subunit-dependent GTPase A [Candidatus Clavichlamydia salmonicola]